MLAVGISRRRRQLRGVQSSGSRVVTAAGAVAVEWAKIRAVMWARVRAVVRTVVRTVMRTVVWRVAVELVDSLAIEAAVTELSTAAATHVLVAGAISRSVLLVRMSSELGSRRDEAQCAQQYDHGVQDMHWWKLVEGSRRLEGVASSGRVEFANDYKVLGKRKRLRGFWTTRMRTRGTSGADLIAQLT